MLRICQPLVSKGHSTLRRVASHGYCQTRSTWISTGTWTRASQAKHSAPHDNDATKLKHFFAVILILFILIYNYL